MIYILILSLLSFFFSPLILPTPGDVRERNTPVKEVKKVKKGKFDRRLDSQLTNAVALAVVSPM
jgi:hypothetical protein